MTRFRLIRNEPPRRLPTRSASEGSGQEPSPSLALRVGVLALLGVLAVGSCFGAEPTLPPALRGVGFDQRVNEQVPLDLAFRDEAGRDVRLGDYFHGKPVILVLA